MPSALAFVHDGRLVEPHFLTSASADSIQTVHIGERTRTIMADDRDDDDYLDLQLNAVR